MRRGGTRRRRRVVIDATWERVARAEFSERKDGGLVLEELAWADVEVRTDEESRWAEKLGEALGRLGGRRGGSEVQLGVPGHLALVKFVRTPAIGKAKRAEVVRFEAAQAIPHALDEVVWDHAVVADDGRELELMLVAAKREAMGEFCESVEGAGFRVRRATPSCVALWQCYRLNYPEADEGVLLVEMGRRATQLVFVEPGRFFVRTLGFAAQGRGSEAGEGVDVAERLQVEISRSLLNARRQGVGLEPKRVLLTGTEAGAARWETIAGMPVERFDALRRVEVSERAEANGARAAAGWLAGAIGLAAVEASRERMPDLLPEKRRSALSARRRRPLWFMAAAIVFLGLGLPTWHAHREREAVERRVGELERRLGPAREAARRNAEERQRWVELQEEVARLRGVVEARTSWARWLAELQDDLAEVRDGWLDRLAVEGAEGALKVAVGGRLVDRARPNEKAGAETYARVKRLLERFEASGRVAAVEEARFDNSQAGVLGFEFRLVMEDGAKW
jgi:Tfp pilus assembly protein, ATPase PilM